MTPVPETQGRCATRRPVAVTSARAAAAVCGCVGQTGRTSRRSPTGSKVSATRTARQSSGRLKQLILKVVMSGWRKTSNTRSLAHEFVVI